MVDIEKSFNEAMFQIYRRAKEEAKYPANIFLNMLNNQGGLMTAKQLINAAHASDGYSHLYERGRLDLTVEALVVENARWHPLFAEEEIQKARRRLIQYNYQPVDRDKA
jgi:hypothetical protein